jgi:TetR/AcrR family transcriptional repressor of nem operon
MGRTSDAREKLLQVAFDLIWNYSYGSVSIDHICEQAGVNKGSFYHFFRTKADLAIWAYEMHWRERQPELDRIFSAQVPPLDRLMQWCDYIQRSQARKAAKYGHVCGCPYASLGAELATQNERVRGKVEELFDRTIRYLESAIAEARRQGLISVEDPRTVAQQIYSSAHGLLLQAKIRNDLSVLQSLPATIAALLRLEEVPA